jgi:RNA polymerase sigma-70 factor (ECF subfamily)
MRQVFESHQPRLSAFALRLTGNPQDAEEIVVSTFLRFWRNAGRYRGDCSLKAYLTRICLNLSRDRMRRYRPTAVEEIAPSPHWAQAGEDERLDLIHEAMKSLPTDDREILILYYLEESTYEELCASLGIKYEVLRTRLVRARKRLRARLGVEDDGS